MEREKVDKAALGYDYKSEREKHQSQRGEEALCLLLWQCNPTLTGGVCSDYSSGFGGRYGVQTDRMDKVSLKMIRSREQLCNLLLHYYNIEW